MKLHTETLNGNLFDASTIINKRGWANYLVTLQSSGMYTIAVFIMPDEMVYEIRRRNQSFVSDVHHDDVVEVKK